MKRLPSSYDVSIKAFRELTDAETDGAATRARLLERAAKPGHRVLRRHLALGALGTALISLSSAAAWKSFPGPWRAPHAQPLDTATDPVFEGLEGLPRQPLRTIPAASDAPAPVEDDYDGEIRMYDTAHRLHFVTGAPARAMAAWDAYLRDYPRGPFAPEARYNRALCLIRLRHLAEAERALETFVRPGGDGYRRAEAERLLDWIRAQGAAGEARVSSRPATSSR